MIQASDSALQTPASIAAVLAAFVAFVSFLFNYRSTLRSQRDNQFFEAMKRFGDKDSPAIRSSAAGLLGQFAVKYPRAYLNTAFQQLLAGFLLETNKVVLRSISEATAQVISQWPIRTTIALADFGALAKKDFVMALMENLADGTDEISDFSLATTYSHLHADSDLTQLEILSGFCTTTLRAILEEYQSWGEFRNSLLLKLVSSRDMGADVSSAAGSEVLRHRIRLRETSERMKTLATLFAKGFNLSSAWWTKIVYSTKRDNLAVFSGLLLAEASFAGDRWCGIHLSSANLVRTYLNAIRIEHVVFDVSDMRLSSMQRAQLNDVRFSYINLEGGSFLNASFKRVVMSDVNLKDVRMWGLRLEDGCDLSEANWWEADFFYSRDNSTGGLNGNEGDIDTTLLKSLFSRHPPRLPVDHRYGGHARRNLHITTVHSSVRLFLESTGSGLGERPRWIEELCAEQAVVQ
jgi:uncharacterized protein YjbI with pentapeptide repeats